MAFRPYLFEDDQGAGLAPAGAPYVDPTRHPANSFPAFDLSAISPYALKANIPGLPQLHGSGYYQTPLGSTLAHASRTAGTPLAQEIELQPDGTVMVAGAPLSTVPDAARLLANPLSQQPEGYYGDMSEANIVLVANASQLVLARPTYQRVLLQIQNNGANPGTVRFGGPASNNGQTIAAGGSSSYLQAVPQNEMWLFSALGTTFWVGYVDMARPSTWAPFAPLPAPLPA